MGSRVLVGMVSPAGQFVATSPLRCCQGLQYPKQPGNVALLPRWIAECGKTEFRVRWTVFSDKDKAYLCACFRQGQLPAGDMKAHAIDVRSRSNSVTC